MMKNILVACLICGMFTVGFSQEKESKEMSPAQFSVNHAYRVYQTALGLNDLESAKSALLDIIVEIPQNDSILFNLAQIYFELQNFSAAAACASQVAKTSPNNLGAIEIAAVSFENLGASEQALANYEKLYLKTDDYGTLYKATMLQFDLERYKEALVNIDILLSKKESDEAKLPLMSTSNVQKEYPVKVILLNLKGMTKEKLGDKAGATEAYKASVALAPDFTSAIENLKAIQK